MGILLVDACLTIDQHYDKWEFQTKKTNWEKDVSYMLSRNSLSFLQLGKFRILKT